MFQFIDDVGPPINFTVTSRTPESLTFSWQSSVDPNGRHGVFRQYDVICYSAGNPPQMTAARSLNYNMEVTFEIEALTPFRNYNCCVNVTTTLATSTIVCRAAETPQDGKSTDIATGLLYST